MSVLDPPQSGAAVGGSAIRLAGGLKGSLGCLVSLGGVRMILSSGHILTTDGVGSPGEKVRLNGTTPIAEFSEMGETLNFGGQNTLDVALAKVTDDTVSPWIGQWGPPTVTPGQVVDGMRVWIWGAVSGRMQARVTDPAWAGLVTYGHRTSHFSGLVQCEPYGQHGDSGAAVVDDSMNLVGVHVGGGTSGGVFCPIAAILTRWPSLAIIGK